MRTLAVAVAVVLALLAPASAHAAEEERVVRTLHAGRFVATVTQTLVGERLDVHRAHAGKRRRIARRLHRRGRFTRIILDKSGVAAYLAVRTLPSGRERVLVRTTDDPSVGRYDEGPDIDRRTLGFAGSVVLWRRAGDLRVRQIGEDVIMDAGRLLRDDGLRMDADSGDLEVRLGGGRPVDAGSVDGACESPGGCGGVDLLRRAGTFLAVRGYTPNGASSSDLELVDLRRGTTRTMDDSSGAYDFVLLESGHAAWVAVDRVDPLTYSSPLTYRIRTDRGALLDEGTGIEPGSLHRRGDQLVWRHGGAERTAPLP